MKKKTPELKNIFSIPIIIATIFIGNKQYPRTQILQNNPTLPPKNLAFTVTINPPTHTIKKIIPKIEVLSTPDSLSDESTTVKANKRHKTNGPHKSPIIVKIYSKLITIS